MIKVKINDNEFTSIVDFPVIEETKSKLNNILNTDISTFSLTDDTGLFMPLSGNSIIDYDSPEENNIEILDENLLLYKGILHHSEIITENIVEFHCKTEINKFLRDNTKYRSWDRYGGFFPLSEYKIINGYPYETPAFAIYHYLQTLGNANFNIDSINRVHDIYDAGDGYIQLNTDFMSLRPKEIINFICQKTNLFIYTDSTGNINFIHGLDYKDNPLLITETIKNDIKSLDELYMFSNYEIEKDDNVLRTATDNGDYGLQYRSIFDIMFEIEKGLIWIPDDNAADYFGMSIIDNFFRRRQGISFKFELGPETFSLERGISITSPKRGWTNKIFDPYGLKKEIKTNKFQVDAYESL